MAGLIHGKQIRDFSIPQDKLDFDLGGGLVQYNGDYHLTVSATISGNSQSTTLTPTRDPASDTGFYVQINGVVVKLGNGVADQSCYFSEDGGNTALEIKDIGTQSVFYWNADVAKYDLTPEDRITFEYEIVGTASLTITNFGGKSPSYYLDRSNHTGFQSANTISDFSYIHNQGVASTVWTINHNLSRFPQVTVVDSSGRQYEGQVDYIDNQTVQVTFNASFAGKAYLV